MKLHYNTVLAPFTTYRVGGPADQFIEASTRNELTQALAYARESGLPYVILGLGANVLISDSGFRGLVIRNRYENLWYKNWASTEHLTVDWVYAGSGTSMEQLISFSLEKGLSGFEHYAGIPSTLGGALWQNLHFMNAARDGGTAFIGDSLHHATIFSMKTGHELVMTGDEFRFGYDQSVLHEGGLVVLDAVFQATKACPLTIGNIIDANLKWRNEKHPPFRSEYSCGSVFKKSGERGAGRLIEAAGLKGYSHNGVTVSRKHANFLTHTGGATAADIMAMVRHVQRTVSDHSGISLEPEIRFIGEF